MADWQKERLDTERSETVDPRNPPNSVLQPEVRSAAFWMYMGPLIAIFVIVGIAFMYWVSRDTRPGEPVEPSIGTSGEGSGEATPGGGNPSPTPDSTRDEVESRQDAR